MSDSLGNVMKMASKSIEAAQLRMRVAAENMANSKSADYVPKSIEFRAKWDKKNKVTIVEAKKIHAHKDRVSQVYDPTHPQANQEGLVTLPKLDPIIALMDLQESRHSHERAMKVYEAATDLKQKMIRLMGG